MGEGKKENEQKGIQWHPAFVSAMNLELAQDRWGLVFEREYNLNTKPLEIDLLIIKKEKDVRIHNEIGHFFQKYNVLEYKAPGDHMDVDIYYKAVAYGCLYKAYAPTVDGIKAEDITVSLLRDARPDGLFRYFEEAGTVVENPYKGIYYLGGNEIFFQTQIIVIKELAEEGHAYLRVLTQKPQEQDVSRFLTLFRSLDGKDDREFAESILEVFAAANRKWMEQWKGESDMGAVLMEIMASELQQAEDKGREEGKREGIREGIREGKREGIREGKREGIREGKREGIYEGIRGTVNVLSNLGFDKMKIKEAVMKQYGLTEKEAAKFL